MPRWSRAQLITVGGIVAVAAVFGLVAYHRRWLADDGLIYVRIVDQIRAGNGPVFNVGERVEGNTSALWPWLLAGIGTITRLDSALLALVVGWLSAVGALVVAMAACARWQRARGSTAALVPLGAIIPLGAYAFWDYATSGLESPLSLLWIAIAWWLLVAMRDTPRRRTEIVAAVVFGLGPLVRPDLGVVTLVFIAAAYLLRRPARRDALVLFAAAFALPVLYEVFRAGYYGLLVPNPALAKSATHSNWARGWDYLFDFIRMYRIWRIAPLFIALLVLYRRHLHGRDRILLLAPVVSSAVLTFYITRVGGDFMHGRMLLPACFLVLAPGMLVPLRRYTAIAAALLALWAVTTVHRVVDGKSHTRIGDERLGYQWFTQAKHPTTPQQFVRRAYDPERRAKALREGLIMSEGGNLTPKSPAYPNALFLAGRLGTGGMAAPLSSHVIDTLGLVHPLGSHITITEPNERPGHQKPLPEAWIAAQFVDPAVADAGVWNTDPADVRAARHAFTCGELAELYAAVREPLTVGRFWDNLVGAVRRTRLIIPASPRDAERALCHP